MARLLIVFMIVLMPLRGWAGDLMSVRATTDALSLQADDAMPIDCPMRARVDTDPASQTPSGKTACTSCDLCIPMAALASPSLEVVTFRAHVVPPLGNVTFRSAAPTLTLRPPIS